MVYGSERYIRSWANEAGDTLDASEARFIIRAVPFNVKVYQRLGYG